jgi:hypothetical protein
VRPQLFSWIFTENCKINQLLMIFFIWKKSAKYILSVWYAYKHIIKIIIIIIIILIIVLKWVNECVAIKSIYQCRYHSHH